MLWFNHITGILNKPKNTVKIIKNKPCIKAKITNRLYDFAKPIIETPKKIIGGINMQLTIKI